jgi:hypothetical protein
MRQQDATEVDQFRPFGQFFHGAILNISADNSSRVGQATTMMVVKPVHNNCGAAPGRSHRG